MGSSFRLLWISAKMISWAPFWTISWLLSLLCDFSQAMQRERPLS
jgi:hypothetical protein